MKTSDELWRWIWEDEDLLDEDALGELLESGGGPAPRPAGLVPPPALTTESVWAWVASDEDLIDRDLLDLDEGSPHLVGPGPAAPTVPQPPTPAVWKAAAPTRRAPPVRKPEEGTEPATPDRRPRVTWGRWARFGALVAVTAAVGAVAPRVIPAVIPGSPDGGSAGAPPPDQLVVAWTVRIEESPDATFVVVLASGAKQPVALAVPAEVTINVPGQGIGTVGEAAAGGDVGLVGVALENLLGVRLDASVDSTTAELQGAVDALGTVEVADQPLTGAQAVQYLTTLEPGALPDERFLRWQDFLDGMLQGLAANPGAVAGFPEVLRPVLAAGTPEPTDLYGLPVVDLGAGLLRPDQKAMTRLVDEHFVRPAADDVRIVVLNGVGVPGIGEEVARILVPEGYRLMSTGNANTFDLKETKIISSSEGDLPAAERARALLGVGRVFLGFQPAGLADIWIVVGPDFVAAHHLGGA